MPELNSDPVECINEGEIENETHREVCDFADDDGSDKMSSEAIAAEFFEEYVCNEDEQSTEPSQGRYGNLYILRVVKL